jgi:hypothetical protein
MGHWENIRGLQHVRFPRNPSRGTAISGRIFIKEANQLDCLEFRSQISTLRLLVDFEVVHCNLDF